MAVLADLNWLEHVIGAQRLDYFAIKSDRGIIRLCFRAAKLTEFLSHSSQRKGRGRKRERCREGGREREKGRETERQEERER